MNSGTISMRYVRALFRYALEKKAEETVFSEMKNLSESFAKNPNLRGALDSPVLGTKGKLNLIITAAGGNVSDVFTRFIELVLHQRRENHLQTISLLYQDKYRKYKNITVGRLITAFPVNDAITNKVSQLVKKDHTGTIEFVTEVDPKITGGFVLYIDSYRLDASVSSQLRRIKEQLLGKNKKIA